MDAIEKAAQEIAKEFFKHPWDELQEEFKDTCRRIAQVASGPIVNDIADYIRKDWNAPNLALAVLGVFAPAGLSEEPGKSDASHL